jgi:hypothetical protein
MKGAQAAGPSPKAVPTGLRADTVCWNRKHPPFLRITRLSGKPGMLPPNGLAPNTQTLQNSFITLGIRVTQVRQKPAPLGDHGQQTLT